MSDADKIKMQGTEIQLQGGLEINALRDMAHANSLAKGFHDATQIASAKGLYVSTLLALIHSEVSEALEEIRAGHPADEVRFEDDGKGGLKPEGVPIELADVVIRVCDLCGLLGIDLETAIAIKHVYNKTRPAKHGGKAF